MARTTTNILAILAICATILFISPTTSNAQDKNLLFVFGDSLYDGGMTLYNGVEGAGAEFWPYGENYFKRPAGRYTDGRVIPDFLAQYAGLPFLRPYLLPGLNDYTQGINFASASACVLVETRPGTINLARQMDYFVEMAWKLRNRIGELETNKLLSKAVYLFNIGGNDLFSLFETNRGGFPLNPYMKKDYVNQILGNLTSHIYTIYNQGGRKFAFQNIGPLGCMPSMKFMLQYQGSCVEEPVELAKMYNAAFSALVNRLQTRLPGFKYTIYDFHTSLHIRVLNGGRYGFKESEIACCGSGPFNGGFSCQKKGNSFTVCSNPADYLWFDAGHTTDRGNEQFASEFWLGGPNVVAPYNLQSFLAMS
ncbi:GDSL esterase/lipase 4-like [Spinacia oleracea]|uniref:GDSL esterase/lipase 4-like n=1 Tax=Spinacia oleracea TaxID=3562 RepID=A0A9R0JUV9_SPIOL|nr:GDSL esterase/lipase 4-like [Spinacia oleracea]